MYYFAGAIHLSVSESESTKRVQISDKADHSVMDHIAPPCDKNLHAAISNAVFHCIKQKEKVSGLLSRSLQTLSDCYSLQILLLLKMS